MKKITTLLIFTALFFLSAGSASASTLHLSPGSTTVAQGSTFSVRVNLNTGGEGINAVSAYLSYPADLLDVVSIAPGGAFSIDAERTFGGGNIRISRGNVNPVTGTVTVATVTFRGKKQGSATVAFVGGSGAPRASDSSDSLNLGGSKGGTYKVGPAPVYATPTTVTPTVVDEIAPVISDVAISDITKTSAVVTWNTDEPADSSVELGLESGTYITSIESTDLVTDHRVLLDNPVLVAGGQFFLRVISRDAVNNTAISEEMPLQLLGYTVHVLVTDANSNPVVGAEVTLHSTPKTSVTDAQGIAAFSDVTAGNHVAVVTLPTGATATNEVVVAGIDEVQVVPVTVESGMPNNNWVFIGAIAAIDIILCIIAIIYFILKKRRQPQIPTIS